ncbi:hypothetical protein J4Q44_G00096860 [Coregonus suidteri]|uniref:Uncharacterized protein n=1 Tax=Coregonus suidteri TaxID=861788 RepID=A0AAN8M1U9_9TELE
MGGEYRKQSTNWLGRQTPTARRCCSEAWPSPSTPWASSAVVVHLVFQYMKMLQTVGPQQRIYEEIQKMKPMSSTTRSRPTP